jgi:hypothetical protein
MNFKVTNVPYLTLAFDPTFYNESTEGLRRTFTKPNTPQHSLYKYKIYKMTHIDHQPHHTLWEARNAQNCPTLSCLRTWRLQTFQRGRKVPSPTPQQ